MACTKQAHSHSLLGQILHGMESSVMGCVPMFCDCMDWKTPRNSSHLINHRCEWTLKLAFLTPMISGAFGQNSILPEAV